MKSITNAPAEELHALVTSGVADGWNVEFRTSLPLMTDAGQLEFLGDVCSFANGPGGNILYGATPRTDAPVELRGFDTLSVAQALTWLEEAVAAGISPRVIGIKFKIVEVTKQKSLLAIHVPKSWSGPHLVSFKDSNQFFSRNQHGKYLLNVGELRSAFLLTESLRDKLRNFRLERMNAITNRTLSIQLSTAPKTVLHIVPLCAFAPGFRIDVSQVAAMEPGMFKPMQSRSLVTHFNYDGMMAFSSMEKFAYSYMQVFRNGCLEAGETLMLELRDGRKYIPGVAFEKEIIQCGERMVGLLRRLEVPPPYVAMLSFLGVKGYSMFIGSMRWQSNAHHIERDDLYLDDVIIEDPTQDFSQIIRPAFDQVWNSCGWAKSMNYDDAGKWHETAR
ncbi:MAG TPA: ATP-binding protein [Verrucomicrobiae bacterium]|nr:ATP-binding protein [Verrucomicrobiae bacterium]